MLFRIALLSTFCILPIASSRNALAALPPMGWCSWGFFWCNGPNATIGDNCTNPETTQCISQALLEGTADAAVSGGFSSAGYSYIAQDDCYAYRNSTTGELQGVSDRFPDISSLGAYMHERGLLLGAYTAESVSTCAGYPGSEGYEQQDAETFASWGVSSLKVDGCGTLDYYATGYPLMGASLRATTADVLYGCSWPDYISHNQSLVPWDDIINAGCNLFRVFDDVYPSWGSVSSIIDYMGDNQPLLAPYHGPGHWMDPDMLKIGAGCLTLDQERSQMAIYAILAAPLFIGSDLRGMNAESKAILLNADAISVDQDPLGQMGWRVENMSTAPQQRWVKVLSNGAAWTVSEGGYNETESPGACFSNTPLATVEAQCCSDPTCAGLSFEGAAASGQGCFKGYPLSGFVNNSNFQGYYKPGGHPEPGLPADITIDFSELDMSNRTATVYDVWAQKSLGDFTGSFTASQVPYQGSAFYIITAAVSGKRRE